MPNFEIQFVTDFDNGVDSKREATAFARVIVVPSLGWAERIAEAMLGEEVWSAENLGRVVSVKQTEPVL